MIRQYRFTDKELKDLLKSITIIVDTREQANQHIIKYFENRKIPYITRKLDYGDYSCYLPSNPELGIMRDTYFDCYIERKGSLEELSGNMTQDRQRLESEFIRAKDSRFIMMIEESAGFEKIINHQYRTQYNEKSFIASLLAFGHRYGIDIHFIDSNYAGLFIYHQLYYFVREYLR